MPPSLSADQCARLTTTWNDGQQHWTQLFDTSGSKGVERITEKGVVANGVEYEVDCIIFATGFEVGTSYTRRAGFEIYGRNGQTLTEYWADGPRTCEFLLPWTQLTGRRLGNGVLP